jgi:ubiquinone/menaquinone biosynthesis C-methylase UbiE
MPSLSASLLLIANRLLPAVDLPGDSDPMAYATWENKTASGLLEVFESARGQGATVRRALDVGCGYGGKTTLLRENTGAGVEWTALDLAQEHLRHAGDWFTQTGHTAIHRTRADAARLPFADASFERIVSADALEHLPRPREVLSEFRRCLHDEGRVVLLFNPWSSPRGSHLADLLHMPWCQVLFSRETLVEATRAEAARRAREATDPAASERMTEHAEALIDHFLNHVHPTKIADLRNWLAEGGELEIESERHFGPGRMRDAGFVSKPWCEEFFSATYAVVLRPAATSASSSARSSSRSSRS